MLGGRIAKFINPFSFLGLSFRGIMYIIFNKVGSTISGITSTLHFWQQAQGIIIIQHRSTSCNYPTKDHHPKPQADPWWTKWSPPNHRCDVGIGCRRLPKGTTHMQRNSLQRYFITGLLSIVVFEPGMFELLEDECHSWKYDKILLFFGILGNVLRIFRNNTWQFTLQRRHLFKTNMLLIREYTSKKKLDEWPEHPPENEVETVFLFTMMMFRCQVYVLLYYPVPRMGSCTNCK